MFQSTSATDLKKYNPSLHDSGITHLCIFAIKFNVDDNERSNRTQQGEHHEDSVDLEAITLLI